MNISAVRLSLLVWLAYALVGAALGLVLRDLRFDDPFITYRFAERLAGGQGFNYNPGRPALITTAPLYALVLAGCAALGFDVPIASYTLGVMALITSAGLVYHLAARRGARWLGFVAGVLMLCFPLLWLTPGFEVLPFVALALVAWWLADQARWALAGGCAGLAAGMRGDGFVLIGVLALFTVLTSLSQWRNPTAWRILFWRIGALSVGALATYAPLALFLTMQFGSPIPTTLQTKSAQAVSGLTGFYPGTRYLEGIGLLAQAYAQQTPLFWVAPALMALGVAGFAACLWTHRAGLRAPLLPLVAWSALHVIGYSALNVAPYVWYYAVPALALIVLIAYGVWVLQRVPRAGRLLSVMGLVCALLPLGYADASIARILHGETPPPASELASKVLPETKVVIYERVGRWIDQHTPPDATLGVTELGVMGYYSRRPVVDFLGLTQPERLAAIRRGDFIGGLIQAQPDYLALTAINAIYDANPQDEDWFRALYAPLATFEDPRFWGSPMTVWQRVQPPALPTVMLDEGVHELGDGWQVTGVRVSAREVLTTTPLVISVRLRAPADPAGLASFGNRELRVQPIVVQRGDGLPVRSRLIRLPSFLPGEEAWYDFAILPYPDARKGAYDISIRWLDGEQEVIAGRVKVPLQESAPAGVNWLPFAEGMAVAQLDAPPEACVGQPVTVTLHWRGGTARADYSVRLEARSADGALVAAHEGQPRNGSYPTTVWSLGEIVPDAHPLVLNAPPGEYALVVALAHPFGGTAPVAAPSSARTPDGNLRVGMLRLRECSVLQSQP